MLSFMPHASATIVFVIRYLNHHADANQDRRLHTGLRAYHKPVTVGLPSPRFDTEVVMKSKRCALTTMIAILTDGV